MRPNQGPRPSRSSTSSPPSARPPREPCRPTATRATVRGGGAWPRLNDDRRDDAAGSIGTHAGGGRSAGVEASMSKSEGSNLMRQVDVQESEGASAHLDRGRFTLYRRRGEHRDYAYEPQTARRGRRRAHLSPRRIDQVMRVIFRNLLLSEEKRGPLANFLVGSRRVRAKKLYGRSQTPVLEFALLNVIFSPS